MIRMKLKRRNGWEREIKEFEESRRRSDKNLERDENKKNVKNIDQGVSKNILKVNEKRKKNNLGNEKKQYLKMNS